MKNEFFLSVIVFVTVFFISIITVNPVSATMCGSGNTGSCQISCNAGQSSIGDPTNACTGMGAGGTVCCSPASTQEYPALQCQAMGGAMGTLGDITCADFTNRYSAGKYLNSACQVLGECCVPSGTPFQGAQACSIASCTATPGQRCTSGFTDTCTFEEQLISDTCPNAASKCCKLLPSCASQGGTCNPSACPTGYGGLAASGCPQNGQCCKALPGGGGGGTVNPPIVSTDYTLLEQIPGTNRWTGDLPSYLKNLYGFTFWAIGIAALLMITIGGFMYATSAGNTARMGTAKAIIFDSVLGLIIAILAWLFLYVINPDFVKLNLPNIGLPPYTPAPPAPGGPPAPTGTYTDTEARQKLQAAGISVNKTVAQGTSLEGIPVAAIDRIILMKTSSGCDTMVTGGTEGGHQTHGAGRAVLDVRNTGCYDNYFIGLGKAETHSKFGIKQFCVTKANPILIQKNVADCLENNTQAHYHFSFN